jgi:hypothetical protein
MGLTIEDGTGSGKTVKVNNDNRLFVSAIVKTEEHDVNERTGKVWTVPFEGLNPAAADDYVVYIKNTGDNLLEIDDIHVMADTAATQVELHAVSGTAAGGTDITPVSHTIGAAATPTATIQSGTDITGLTNDGILAFMQCAVVNTQYDLQLTSKIAIPKGKAVAILVETGTANITGFMTIYEDA